MTWNRRKLITVNGSTAGVQSDYQMKLTVNQGIGTDSAGIVYLGGNVLDSFNDLRFAKSDGTTTLNYWIESITGTSQNKIATVWIKLAPYPDIIPASPSTYNFYIYYDNSSAASLSNGANTFLYYEDFESYTAGNTINGVNNWSSPYPNAYEIVSNDYSVSPGTKSLKLSAPGGGGDTWGTANKLLPVKLTDDHIVEYDFRTNKTYGYWSYEYSQMYDGTKAISGIGEGRGYASQADKFVYHSPDGTVLTTYAVNTWYKLRMDLLYSTKKVSHYINGTRYTTDVNFSDATATGLTNIYFHLYGTSDPGYAAWIDNIRIRKYAAIEPTFSTTTGIEELIATNPAAEGGTITASGIYRIHTFTSSGTFITNKSMNVEYLVVAGGGAGGGEVSNGAAGGGGGAGGFMTGSGMLLNATYYPVIVGTGGIGWTGRQAIPASAYGGNSSFNGIVSIGGGGGSSYSYTGGAGGSGGGAGSEQTSVSGGTGTSGQGHAGGSSGTTNNGACGNGGGASEVGTTTTTGTTHGGNGIASSISESSVTYAGGGGGGGDPSSGTFNPGSGGVGGGGAGGIASSSSLANGTSGISNTGGGGGGRGQGTGTYYSGSGGSGIVIIRYLSSEDVTATNMAITPRETPCRVGICKVDVNVTWKNNGLLTSSFVPSITVNSGTVETVYSSQNLIAGASVTLPFTVSGMTVGTCSICPNPN